MVWASVPAAAILSHFPISDLQILADSDRICSEILNLDAFQPKRRTRDVSIRMREQQNSINTTTAQAIAAISRVFGMHRDRVSLVHIQGLVAALVDSFKFIHDDSSTGDVHKTSRIAHTFAQRLRSRIHSVQDVALAFSNGVKQGTDVIAYYSRRRS
jgi:hypothetical protein